MSRRRQRRRIGDLHPMKPRNRVRCSPPHATDGSAILRSTTMISIPSRQKIHLPDSVLREHILLVDRCMSVKKCFPCLLLRHRDSPISSVSKSIHIKTNNASSADPIIKIIVMYSDDPVIVRPAGNKSI